MFAVEVEQRVAEILAKSNQEVNYYYKCYKVKYSKQEIESLNQEIPCILPNNPTVSIESSDQEIPRTSSSSNLTSPDKLTNQGSPDESLNKEIPGQSTTSKESKIKRNRKNRTQRKRNMKALADPEVMNLTSPDKLANQGSPEESLNKEIPGQSTTSKESKIKRNLKKRTQSKMKALADPEVMKKKIEKLKARRKMRNFYRQEAKRDLVTAEILAKVASGELASLPVPFTTPGSDKLHYTLVQPRVPYTDGLSTRKLRRAANSKKRYEEFQKRNSEVNPVLQSNDDDKQSEVNPTRESENVDLQESDINPVGESKDDDLQESKVDFVEVSESDLKQTEMNPTCESNEGDISQSKVDFAKVAESDFKESETNLTVKLNEDHIVIDFHARDKLLSASSSVEKVTRKQRCKKCARHGHFEINCIYPPRKRPVERMKCLNCKEKGHKIKDCAKPSRRRTEAERCLTGDPNEGDVTLARATPQDNLESH